MRFVIFTAIASLFLLVSCSSAEAEKEAKCSSILTKYTKECRNR